MGLTHAWSMSIHSCTPNLQGQNMLLLRVSIIPPESAHGM